MTYHVYLAGPGVFMKDPVAEGERLKAICRSFGLEGVFPMDAALNLSGLTKREAAQAIYEANIKLITQSDGVLADMQPFRGPGMDGGTAFEMGYAKALNLPVIGYGAPATYLERCKDMLRTSSQNDQTYDDQFMLVEDFDLEDNLMMSCGADVHVADLAAACRTFIRLCETA